MINEIRCYIFDLKLFSAAGQPTIFSERYNKKFFVDEPVANISIGTNITIYENTKLVIRCKVKANSSQYKIKWSTTSSSHSFKLLVKDEAFIILNKVTQKDGGVYKCTVNKGHTDGDEETSNIIVKGFKFMFLYFYIYLFLYLYISLITDQLIMKLHRSLCY